MMMICIKMDLALNNLQWLICHETKPINCYEAYSFFISSQEIHNALSCVGLVYHKL